MSLSSNDLTRTTATLEAPKTSTTCDPMIGPMSFFKTERGGINLCMNGFSYQKAKELKNEIKWWCCESRNKSMKCPVVLYTGYNFGDDDHPEFEYKKITGNHNHEPDNDKLVIQKFKSNLKQMVQSPVNSPSTAIYNQLVATMKLEKNQMARLPFFNTIREY